MKSLVYCKTPYSGLKITCADNHLTEIDFVDRLGSKQITRDKLLSEVLKQIQQYVQSPFFSFDLPLDPQGTDFQRKVWALLRTIPAGQMKPTVK